MFASPTDRASLRRLFEYNAWANARLVERLEDHGEPLRLTSHILTAERIWLTRLRGEPTDGIAIWPTLTSDACASLASTNAAAYRSYLDALDEHDLSEAVHYRNSKGTEYHTPVADILTHVLLHSAYHRGQAAMALRDAGAEPPVTDFIIFVREGH